MPGKKKKPSGMDFLAPPKGKDEIFTNPQVDLKQRSDSFCSDGTDNVER